MIGYISLSSIAESSTISFTEQWVAYVIIYLHYIKFVWFSVESIPRSLQHDREDTSVHKVWHHKSSSSVNPLVIYEVIARACADGQLSSVIAQKIRDVRHRVPFFHFHFNFFYVIISSKHLIPNEIMQVYYVPYTYCTALAASIIIFSYFAYIGVGICIGIWKYFFNQRFEIPSAFYCYRNNIGSSFFQSIAAHNTMLC